MTACLFETRA